MLCLKLIQTCTWGTLVVTGKDDNVSGFSECEIRDVGVSSVTPARLRVYRLANTYSLHSVSSLIDTALIR